MTPQTEEGLPKQIGPSLVLHPSLLFAQSSETLLQEDPRVGHKDINGGT